MKKRFLTLGMILLLSLTVCACTKTKEPSQYDIYVGDYQDSFSQRATARVDLAKEDGVIITIDWSDSAFSYCEWVATAKLKDGKLEYTDMKETYVEYDEDGKNHTDTVNAENVSGYFEWDNGTMSWTGSGDEYRSQCKFKKMDY